MHSLLLGVRRRLRRLAFHGLRTLSRLTGFGRARSVGKVLGELEFRLAWRRRGRCERDMAKALGRPAGDAGVRELLRQAHRVNAAAVLEILAMLDRRQDDAMLAAGCELSGVEHLESALAAGRGAILLGTHMGNGALMAVRLAARGIPLSVAYRQARMMPEGFLGRGLSLYGIEAILANDGIRAYGRMLDALRRGRVVFVTMDQGVRSDRDGVMVHFLGKEMAVPAGPAQLARHARAPLLPVVATGAEPVWRFRIEAPLPAPSGPLRNEVEGLARVTERHVLDHPHLWSWHHRRWRKYAAMASAPRRAEGVRPAPSKLSSK